MTIATGTRFDRYEILSLLGQGGMGEVYLAQDTRLKRKVALKLLPAAFTQDADRVRRFEQEAQAASALNHPNIITIYEIGEVDGAHFIGAEFIDGQTLRQQLAGAQMNLSAALEVASQVAAALSAAHEAGIVHRDIKPENIMLRRDGLVKVLDFGLAKLTERRAVTPDTDAPTNAGNTDPGTVMGTAQYMSPEQARGLEVDARTDIFSLGVVMYEMVAGRSPFEGATVADLFAAILKVEPPPLSRYSSAAPAELERIVTKALEKDREERYQVVKDLLLDLKKLKRRMEFEADLERSTQSDVRSGAITAETANISGQVSAPTAQAEAAQTSGAAAIPTISSAKIILGEIKRHRLGVALTLAVIVMAATAAFFYFNRKPVLTDKDTILLADFVNSTGDAVFDGTLKEALAVQLGQSPFLNIFSDERIREALRYMGRSPDERVTRTVAREICQRQGLKALLTGSISSLGRNYVIALEAVNGQNGDVIAREQVEAESKEQVLKTLGRAATQLREKLGESLNSIRKFDAPLEQATTSSLEALKAYSLGRELIRGSKYLEMIPSLKRAIELDPNFALAYAELAVAYRNSGQGELAIEFAQKAFELRERASELEKIRISLAYYTDVTRELDKQFETVELWKRNYPRESDPHHSLGLRYNSIGQYEKAIEESSEAIRLDPNRSFAYTNLGTAFIRLNRFEEAKEIIERALQQKLDATSYHTSLYAIAFVHGDTAAMKQQIDWATGKPDEYVALGWQAGTAAFAGQQRQAREFNRRAVEMAERRNVKEVAAGSAAQGAVWDAGVGHCQQVRADTARALALSRDWLTVLRSAYALARCEPGQAPPLADELAQRFPKDTLVQTIWLPQLRATIELQRGNAAQALQLLQPVSPYEAATVFSLPSLRGEAYLKLSKGAEAAAEFQKVLGHRGWAPLSPLYPLAHLGLARASAMQGDAAKARKSYQDFFALWKDADADLPALIEAKKEYEKVK